MSERLSVTQIVMLLAYAASMGVGQLLFKLASSRQVAGVAGIERLVGLLYNWAFLAACALYFVLSVVWVWILSFTPLSRAYPFMALTFLLTPLVGGVVFGEPLSMRLIVGLVVVFGGLLLVVT